MSGTSAITAADRLKDEGNIAHAAGDLRTAVEKYTAAISLNPKNAVYFANRAAVRIAFGQFAEAAIDCQAALQIDPSYVKAYYRLGTALSNDSRRRDDAALALRRAEDLAANDPAMSTVIKNALFKLVGKDNVRMTPDEEGLRDYNRRAGGDTAALPDRARELSEFLYQGGAKLAWNSDTMESATWRRRDALLLAKAPALCQMCGMTAAIHVCQCRLAYYCSTFCCDLHYLQGHNCNEDPFRSVAEGVGQSPKYPLQEAACGQVSGDWNTLFLIQNRSTRTEEMRQRKFSISLQEHRIRQCGADNQQYHSRDSDYHKSINKAALEFKQHLPDGMYQIVMSYAPGFFSDINAVRGQSLERMGNANKLICAIEVRSSDDCSDIERLHRVMIDYRSRNTRVHGSRVAGHPSTSWTELVVRTINEDVKNKHTELGRVHLAHNEAENTKWQMYHFVFSSDMKTDIPGINREALPWYKAHIALLTEFNKVIAQMRDETKTQHIRGVQLCLYGRSEGYGNTFSSSDVTMHAQLIRRSIPRFQS